jgi:hypothetical protein
MVLSSYDRAHDPPKKSFEEHQLPTSNMSYISISFCQMFMFFGNYSKCYIWSAHFNNYTEEMTQNKVSFLMFQHLLSQKQLI